jgi:hypothetical protein
MSRWMWRSGQRKSDGAMQENWQHPFPDNSVLVLALKTILHRRFVAGNPTQDELAKASPLLTLESFGGPTKPSPEERPKRLSEIRRFLGSVAPRLANLAPAELEAAQIPLEPGPGEDEAAFWAREARLLADAAVTVFQLNAPKPKPLKNGLLYGAARELYIEDRKEREVEEPSRNPQWFERSRQYDFLLRKLAEWIIEHERQHRDSRYSGTSEPPPSEARDPETAIDKTALEDRGPVDKPSGQKLSDKQPATSKALPKKKAKEASRKATKAPTPRRVRRRPHRRAAPKPLGKVGILLGLIVAAPLFVAILSSGSNSPDRNVEEARQLFKIDGNDAPKFAWRPSPLPQQPTEADARDVSIFLCEQTVTTCTPTTPGAVQFRLNGIHHEDRRSGGLDNWDFIFKPYLGHTPIQTPLQVVYRANTAGTRSAGLVWGGAGDGALPNENLVAQLNSIDDTEFANDFLDKLRNDAGLRWGKEGGLETTARRTSLTERAAGGGESPSAAPAFPASTDAWSAS